MIGETLADRFLLTDISHSGKSLSTYTALDQVLGIEVEIDVLAIHEEQYDLQVRRLEAILDAAMQVCGPNVSPLHGWGDEIDKGFFWVAREKAGGTLLSEVLADTAELPRQQVVEITAAAVEVLAEAYGRGLFYLGLNPEQVLLDGRGGVKFLRVGFAWLLEEMEPELAARVSPYRAPETDGGKEGSRTSDVYSLAVMLSEMLPAEEAGNRLGSLLEMAMDPLPKRRPSSPRLLLEELEKGKSGGRDGPPDRGTEDTEAPPGSGGGLAFLEREDAYPLVNPPLRPRRRTLRNLLLVLAGGLVLWLVFAAVAGLLKGKTAQETQAPAVVEDKVTLPDLQGLTAAEAEEVLDDLGLRCVSREAPSRLWSAGRVAAQEPGEGSVLLPGETVCLIISSGKEEGTALESDGGQEAGEPDPSTTSPGPAAGASPQAEAPRSSPRDSSPPSSPPAPNLPPHAVAVVSCGSGPAPLYVAMDGSASYDPDGSIVRYVWHCGDGTVIEGVKAQHVYDPAVIPARFQIVLEVYDSDGMSHSSSSMLEVY
jgi:serine/threonine protein kinase